MPDDQTHHIELAELFAQAGDDRNALVHFQRALIFAPDHPEALTGAGEAAFKLGQYPLARRYLNQVSNDVEATRHLKDVVALVVSRDPIAARLGVRERRRRLDVDIAYVQQRMAACIERQNGEPSPADQLALQAELQTFERSLRRSATLDQDTIESGVDLIDRVERDVVERCGPPNAVDQALLLIAREHGTDSR